MITKVVATKAAQEFLSRDASLAKIKPVLLESKTREAETAWIFFYDSEEHIASGDYRDALAGGGLVFVDKANGTVHSFSSAFPVQAYIRVYDQLRRAGAVTTADVLTRIREEHLASKG